MLSRSRPLQYLSGLRPVARSLQFPFSGHFVPCCNICRHHGHHFSFGGFWFRFFSIERDVHVTYLLVDADHVGKDLVDEAKSCLIDKHAEVLVFGNPQLRKAKRWTEFFTAPEHQFHAVERVGGLNDPNDDAIKREAARLLRLPKTKGFALLAFDRDFVELVEMVRSFGKEMVVFLSKHRCGSLKAFEEAGAAVFLVGPEREVNKVRAILNSDGSGSTELAEDPADLEYMALRENVGNRLLSLGYTSDDSCHLRPALAKFWFRTIHSALRSAHMVLQGQRKMKALTSDKEDLAFILPLSGGSRSTHKISSADRQLYDHVRAKRIYHGGGPFILRQSRCLTRTVLRRLGYLDDAMNSDFNEALLIFLNSSDNKRNLRKTTMMPNVEDSPREIQSKINQALVSGQSDGMWSLAPSDTDVRNKLVAERLLVNSQQPREEILAAMQEFTRRHGLRAMKSYNGYVWQLKQLHSASDPRRRDEVKPSCLLKWHLRHEKVRAPYSMFLLHVVCHCWHDSWIMTIHQSAICSEFLVVNAANTVHFCTRTLLSYTIHRSYSHCHCWMRVSSWWFPNLTSHVTSLSMLLWVCTEVNHSSPVHSRMQKRPHKHRKADRQDLCLALFESCTPSPARSFRTLRFDMMSHDWSTFYTFGVYSVRVRRKSWHPCRRRQWKTLSLEPELEKENKVRLTWQRIWNSKLFLSCSKLPCWAANGPHAFSCLQHHIAAGHMLHCCLHTQDHSSSFGAVPSVLLNQWQSFESALTECYRLEP